MRNILFRGKCLKNGEWAHGYYWNQDFSKHYIHAPVILHKINIQIDPNTLGQFTGLTDKNDNKIFEGDILAFQDRICFVYWHELCGAWDCRFIKMTSDVDPEFSEIHKGTPVYWHSFAEVVGNLYDNPELSDPCA